MLALYNPKAKIKVLADASSFGLSAVLLKQDDRGWHPVAFASRSLSEVEQRYVCANRKGGACHYLVM